MNTFLALPTWAVVLIGLGLLVLVAVIAVALFGFFFKLAVIAGEARRPPHLDAGDYALDQGRDVRPEQSGRPADRRS